MQGGSCCPSLQFVRNVCAEKAQHSLKVDEGNVSAELVLWATSVLWHWHLLSLCYVKVTMCVSQRCASVVNPVNHCDFISAGDPDSDHICQKKNQHCGSSALAQGLIFSIEQASRDRPDPSRK
jgi:hypothetical protein